MLRPVVVAGLPFALLSLARDFEGALGLVLHTGLREPGLLFAALGTFFDRPGPLIAHAGLFTAVGLALWAALALLQARLGGGAWRAAAVAEATTFQPLYLVPASTLLAATALGLRPDWPYAHTLVVAFGQDLAPARDVAVAAALLARRLPAFSLPAPRAIEVCFVSFLAYALLTPDWARNWDNHPGNEPKYLRMAVALGHRMSLDVEPVSASMEELAPPPFKASLTSAAAGLFRESRAMAKALASGPEGVGRDAIRATRIVRQTIGGKDGGVYHVLAPGPSMLLAPTLRIDRALNLRHGTPGRLAVSVLLFNALGALLVMAVFQLARDVTGRPGLAAAIAFAFALLPPFLFYFFQFYPEMPGALVLAVLFRWLFLRDRLSAPVAWSAGLLLGSLPWLHQKFLPVWFLLGATALLQTYRSRAPRAILLGLFLPQAASLYLTALYNFGIAGSVRPDALFLAWGPGGVTSARVGQGLLGLWLDARYGLLPMAPVYALGAAGLALALLAGRGAGGDRNSASGAARLRLALPAAFVYYLTVAAADNWAGAVCNLGRYLMPILPLAVAFAAIALDRAGVRRGVLAVALTLLGVSGLAALALWQDPHAANDSALLLARSRFADAFVYVPGLFIRTWSAGAPGLFVRLAAWLVLVGALAWWTMRAAGGRGGQDAGRAVAGLLASLLAAAVLLERWPGRRDAPWLGPAVELTGGRTVFARGPVQEKEGALELGPGETVLVVRSPPEAPGRLRALVGGTGLVAAAGGAVVALRPQGVLLDLPLEPGAVVSGGEGSRETITRARIEVSGPPAALRFPEGVAPGGLASRSESVELPVPEER